MILIALERSSKPGYELSNSPFSDISVILQVRDDATAINVLNFCVLDTHNVRFCSRSVEKELSSTPLKPAGYTRNALPPFLNENSQSFSICEVT